MDINALTLRITAITSGLKQAINKAGSDIKKYSSDISKSSKVAGDSVSGMNKKIKAGADSAAASFNKVKNAQAGLTANIRKMLGPILGLVSAYKALKFAGEGFNMAQKQQADLNLLSRMLQGSNKDFNNWVKNQARGFNLSEAAATKYGATYANLLGGFINNSKDLGKYTTEMLKTSAVVANATGRTIEDVNERIRSGLLGNTESIEDLGINVNVALLETTDAFKKLSNGLSWEKLDFQTQQYIRMMAIMEQSNKKFGNSVPVNPMLQFQAALADLKLALGQAVLPIVHTVIPYITAFVNTLAKAVSFIGQVVTSLTGFKMPAQQIGEVVNSIEDSYSGATDVMSEMGDEADTTAEQVKKAAKKMKGALLGIDEINILNRPEETETASAKKTGAKVPSFAGIKVPDISGAINDVEVTDKAKALADRIKSIYRNLADELKPIGEMIKRAVGEAWKVDGGILKDNFGRAIQNTIDILKDFRDVLKTPEMERFVKNMTSFGILLGAVALNIYNNFVAPLIRWFIQSLPDALKVFNPFIEEVNERLRHLADPQTGTEGMERIIRALDRLKNAFLPFTARIGDGLLWVYDNVLEPLGKWTWNELIPRFIDILAGVFGVLNSTIDALAPLWNDLWATFFKPISEWTGGVVLGVLDTLIGLLGNLGKWIREHQETVRNITTYLLGFAIAWGVVTAAQKVYNTVTVVTKAITAWFSGGGMAAMVASFNPLVIVLGLVIGAFIWYRTHLDEMPALTAYAVARLKYNFTEFLLVMQMAFTGVMDGISTAINKAVAFIAEKLVGIAQAFYDLTGKGAGALEALKTAAEGNLIPVGDKMDELKGKWADNVQAVTDAKAVYDRDLSAIRASSESNLPAAGYNMDALAQATKNATGQIDESLYGTQGVIDSGFNFDIPVGNMAAMEEQAKTSTDNIYQSINKGYGSSYDAVNDTMGRIEKTTTEKMGATNTAMGLKSTLIATVTTATWQGMWKGMETTISNFSQNTGGFMDRIYQSIKNMTTGSSQALMQLAQAFNSIRFDLKGPINAAISEANAGLARIANTVVYGANGGGFTPYRVQFAQYLAKGGIATAATPAIVGEAGKEAIIPLDRNTAGLDMIAQKISQRIGNTGSTGPITVQVTLDGRILGETTVDYINGKTKQTGTSPILGVY